MIKITGFTLMEMMVVLAIICILAVLMMPVPQDNIARKQIAESLELIEGYKKQLTLNYQSNQTFPDSNKDADIPDPEKLIGNFVTKIELTNGAFHLYFGNKAHLNLKNKILSVRPISVKDSPESPISWVCGFSIVPDGMIAVGNNLTNIDKKLLPLGCR
jgi:type IV pilus assembly protein PilA